MTRDSKSIHITLSGIAPSRALRGAVRQALYSPRRWLRAGVLAAGFAGVIPLADSAPFPAVLPLASLYPAGGGDGSQGFVLTGIDTFDFSGRSVSAAGDVNGDGIDDVIVGASYASPGGHFQAGESYVVFGSTQGFPAVLPLARLFPTAGGDGTQGFVLAGIDAYDGSGYSVSAAGDINGDGIDDLIVGVNPIGHTYAGESYVVFGSAQSFPAVLPLARLFPAGGGDGSQGFVLDGIDAYDFSGSSVSAAGDVNGDGIDDLIIGADGADPDGDSRAGESYVVFGSTQGFPAVFPLASLFPAGGGDGSAGFVLAGIDANDMSGRSVSAAGDVNGDGVDDLIIGAFLAGGVHYAGESYVIFGSTQGFPAVFPLARLYPAAGGDGTQGFVLAGIDPYDFSGVSVGAAGDVNGDGIDGSIIGALAADPRAGSSYVVFGSTQGFPAVLPLARLYPAGGGDGSAGFVLAGIDARDYSGISVSGAGDVNGDGIDDVIIGAVGADPRGRPYAGESYVVFGSTQGFPAVLPLASLFSAGGGDGTQGFVLAGIDEDDFSGFSVSGAGDVNSDGIDDLIIGAWTADQNGHSEAGESYVVFGRGPAR